MTENEFGERTGSDYAAFAVGALGFFTFAAGVAVTSIPAVILGLFLKLLAVGFFASQRSRAD